MSDGEVAARLDRIERQLERHDQQFDVLSLEMRAGFAELRAMFDFLADFRRKYQQHSH
ncbi:MAG: hypothetical protein M3P96_16170 [Actinomycetota bacterium]|nr:hypothetical protein [Actinomycetota bacterium]